MIKLKNIEMQKYLDGIIYSNKVSPLFITALFILNIIWFCDLRFYTMMGDDIYSWFQWSNKTSFWEAFTDASANKYRPVLDVIHFILFKLFSYNYQLFFYFNILLNYVVIFALYKLVQKISNQNNVIAFVISIIYLTSRFSYYNILQLYGIMEAVCLFLLLLIINFSVDFIRTGRSNFAFYSLGINLIIVFTHERYIALIPFLFFILLFNDSIKGTLKRILLLSLFVPLLLNFLLKKFVFNTRFLEGTLYVPLEFNPLSIVKLLISGFLTIMGINAGPAYLNGISFKDVDTLTNIVIGIIISLFIFIGILTVFQYRRLDLSERKKELKIAFLWGALFFSLLLVSSIAIIQELRWLYAPFVVFLIYLSYQSSKVSLHPIAKYAVLVLLCFFIARNDMYYKTFLPNVFFVEARKIADSVYDETIKKYGTEIKNYAVYIEKNRQLDWPLLGSLFFTLYSGDKSFTVNYVDDVRKIKLNKKDMSKALIFKLDGLRCKLKNITEEVKYIIEKKDEEKIKHISYDFIKEFAKGEINPKQNVSTPTGQGALLMEWEADIIKRKSLTIISGFACSYPNIIPRKHDRLNFSLLMPLNSGDGARAFIDILDKKGKKRVFEKDIKPLTPDNPSSWQNVELSLEAYKYKRVTVIFGTESPSGDQTADWVAFGDAKIVRY